jgi:xanthine dehydrogenase small subunit
MRDTIHFRLGTEARTLSGVDPTMTVLQYLREAERLCGTKEGCAEGDCGACTVILAGADGHQQAVNACVLFVPALDGKRLLAVEHLAAADGTPHPVQRAMVDFHASQCGFCTPGFVMSIAALRTEGVADRAAVNEALAGNLCRCTGYRPIVDAALSVCDGAVAVPFEPVAVPEGMLALGGRGFSPRSVDELAEVLERHKDAVIVAGGTDVGLWVTKQHRVLPVTVCLDAVAGFDLVRVGDGAVEIGAGATYTAALPALEAHWPDLGGLIRRIGSRQIRNRGTIGGNIANASPIGDMPPPLLALDASVVLRKGGERRLVALAEFFTGYRRTVMGAGEFIERIDVPLPVAGDAFRCYKVSKRFDQDISAVCGAFRVRVEDGVVRLARVAFGGMAATPVRVGAVEDFLVGRAWTEATVRSAQAVLDGALAPLSDMRASAGYRRTVARNLLMKLFLETSEGAAATRLVPA